jgi:four helix bundle protein
MGAKKLDDLIAFQLARDFKIEIYRIARAHPEATRNMEYRNQLFGAAASGESNVAEGYYRFAPAEFARFLGFARGSIGEAEVRLLDGVARGYFEEAECQEALRLAHRALGCVTALKTSLEAVAPKPRQPRFKPGKPRT